MPNVARWPQLDRPCVAKAKELLGKMIRGVAWILVIFGLAGALYWARDIAAMMNAPPLRVTDAARAIEQGTVERPPPDRAAAEQTMRWPALFGELQPPAPPAPAPQAEPDPPAAEPQPPAPPLSSLSYRLKGVVRSGETVWAMVSHPTGERILKVGDALEDGLTVVRIDSNGLWVDTGRAEAELLGFDADTP